MPVDLSTYRARRLDHLPIVGNALKKLRIREHVDARVPTDPRSHVTTGEAIECLIAAIVMGKHTLYRVDELLAPYDLELAFGWLIRRGVPDRGFRHSRPPDEGSVEARPVAEGLRRA